MTTTPWECFDADKPDPKMVMVILELSAKILTTRGVDKNDRTAVRSFAAKEISDYLSGSNPEPV